ncbi:SapC family protein [Aquabacter sp. L1I39]|uniref:SapC family protein n=1 Tax=Aquabacter sp. L1I39 TaxID=2820278 RepID=UPI001ADB6EA4|nr:SapC family protein [Aquabacter sp. L1I39]QTL05812.1 SapC family protein [Aquabacter sp. L1I39]
MSADELSFRPLRKGERTPWSKIARFGFLDQIERVPLGDSELLQTAHYLPILVERRGEVLDVVAGVSATLQRQPLLDKDQRWLRFYTPLYLKCLPFTLGLPVLSPQEQLRIAVSDTLLHAVESEANITFEADGTPSRALAENVALLKRLQVGICKLREAAELLYLADLLMPINVTFQGGGEVLAVDAEKLSGFSAGRCVPLVRGGLLASQLLFAMLFSRRMLSGTLGVSVHRTADQEPAPTKAVATAHDQFSAMFSGLENLDFAMDESDLVPIEPLSEARE